MLLYELSGSRLRAVNELFASMKPILPDLPLICSLSPARPRVRLSGQYGIVYSKSSDFPTRSRSFKLRLSDVGQSAVSDTHPPVP